MPIIFALKNDKERDIYFLIKESFFPFEAVQLLKTRLNNYVKFNEDYNREELIQIAEITLEEYDCTLIPFTMFNIKY